MKNPGSGYFGKYRGTVLNNIDPMKMGRIQVRVPDVLGDLPSSWALPCVPVAGLQMGAYAIPPMNAGVWVEFEQGNLDYPIWTGCWWGSAAEVPALTQLAPPMISQIAFQTTNQNSLLISDMPGPTGGIVLKTAAGATIMINDIGITISNGKGAMITLTANVVNVNNGALVVM